MTAIEWTHRPGTVGRVWNPVSGCTKVSEGCRHCYAETMANRFWESQYPDWPERPRRFTDVLCHEDRLDAPLHWRKPATFFVNSMSDLFHEAVPDAFIDRVFAVMALCPQHTFIVLTKRPARMREYMRRERDYEHDPREGHHGASGELPPRAAARQADGAEARRRRRGIRPHRQP